MKHILIVEDEPDIQELLCAYLQDAGYGTAAAGDGVAALELFQSRPFDLVLLDLMLPKIDGCSPFLRFSLSPSRKETSIRHSSPGPEVQVLPQSRILTFPLLSVRLS